jgi:two-component system chemotaxis sensor kinase CheA
MIELLAQFVTESRDLVQEAGEDLLALERRPEDADAINRLFRSVHTLKGSSGLFDVPPLTQVLHAAEDIFQAVREDGLKLTPEMVDLALKSFDQVGKWIEHLDGHETLPAAAAPIAHELVRELRGNFQSSAEKLLQNPFMSSKLNAPVTSADLARWFDSDVLLATAGTPAGQRSINLISYLPDESCFFRGEDPLHLVLQIPQLEALSAEPSAPWSPLEDLDPFVSNLDFHAISAAPRAALDDLFRYVPDQVTITEFSMSALARSEQKAASALPAVVQALLSEQLEVLAFEPPADELAGRIAAVARTAANALRFANQGEQAGRVEEAGIASHAHCSGGELIAAISAILADMTESPAAESGIEMVPDAIASNSAGDGSARTAPRTLRVDQEKIDALMKLVGELIVAKNSLPFLARRADEQYGLRELGREIKEQYSVIDRIAQELQGAVMSVRMMPVGQVFQRFPRLVRDLSRKLGKQVDLVIEGEETEADKNVIESLFDPLLHMVRNSLDHGVETPEERSASGKSSTGTVRLLASHDGDQVVIEVIDDGRGIDPEAIKRKAYERGLLNESRLATITDDEATMLIFAAGFSTVEQISDVSGRGVGMDVVRSAVEKAGGRVTMTSAKGKGTTVRLNLPLSMAVSRVMTVSLGKRLFGIPMDLVHGTLKVPHADVIRIKDSEAFVLRDCVVPLVHLSRLLDLPPEPQADEVAVLVVQVGGQTIGLGITAFGEGMELILKPLEGALARLSGYNGTALLGDGRVLLILDLKELLP